MTAEDDGGVDRAGSEYARPGNYYIMEGTWVRDPNLASKSLGVVANVESHGEDSPREGSINILWFPNTSEHLSAWMLRRKLRDGRIVIANDQHPYDKVDWKTAADGGEPSAE